MRRGVVVGVLVLGGVMAPMAQAQEPGQAVAQGPAAAQGQAAAIEQVLQLSGLKDQISQAPAVMEAQLRRREQAGALPPEVLSAMKAALGEAFHPDLLLSSVRHSLEGAYDQQKFADILARLQLPLVVTMTRLEIASENPDPKVVQAFVAPLQQSPPAEARVALMRRLERAVETERMIERISIVTTEGLAKGLSAASEMPPPPPGQIEAAVKQQMAAQTQAAQTSMLVRDLFTYRAVTDADLTQYAAILETEIGRWFTRVGQEALLQAYAEASERMAVKLAETAKTWKRPAPADAAPSAAPAVPPKP